MLYRHNLASKYKNGVETDNILAIWCFVLFLFAGNFKADPVLAYIQQRVDFTLLFFLLSFGLFLNSLLKKQLHFKVPRIFSIMSFLFFLLAAILLSGTLWHSSTGYGLQKALRFIIFTGWAFFGPFLLIKTSYSFKHFTWALSGIAFVMAVDAVIHYSLSKNTYFLSAFGSNYISLAYDTGLGLLTSLLFLLPTTKRILLRLGLLVIIILQFWAMFRSGSRGPVFSLLLSILIFFIISIHGRLLNLETDRFAIRLGIITLLLIAVLAVASSQLFPTLTSRVRILWNGGGMSAMTRIDFFKDAISQWTKSPILGIGTGQFSVGILGFETRLYPHDIILELLSENGIIGATIFILMLIISFKKGLQTLHINDLMHRTIGKYLITATIFAVFNAMVSGDINDNRIMFTFVSLLSISKILGDLYVRKNSKYQDNFTYAKKGDKRI